MNGTTAGNYSAVTWSYNISTKSCDEKQSHCPIVFFTQAGFEISERTDSNCINTTNKNFGIDPRFLVMSQKPVEVGLDRNCSENDGHIVCVGTFNMSMGFRSQFFASLGWPCGQTKRPLDVTFDLNVTGYNNGEIPCSDWSDALDQLNPPLPPGLIHVISRCSALYGKFSRWNSLGFSQYHFKLLYAYLISQPACYQKLPLLGCRSVLPECTDASIIEPCRDMCEELKHACAEKIFYNVSCATLKYMAAPGGPKCFYESCECDTQMFLPANGKVISNGGNLATNVSEIGCQTFYRLNVPHLNATCGFDGNWHYSSNGASCDVVIGYVVGAAVAGCSVIFMIVAVVIYKNRLKLKLAAFKYCKCGLFLFRCCRKKRPKDKVYHTFIAYESSHRSFVDTKVYEPLKSAGVNVFVDYDHPRLQFGSNLFRDFAEIIDQSASFIAIVNRDFTDSPWCMYEFNVALLCKLDDPDYEIVIVVTEPLEKLRHAPSWFRNYVTSHLYIQSDDPDLLAKLQQSLTPMMDQSLLTSDDVRGRVQHTNSVDAHDDSSDSRALLVSD